MRVLEAGGSCDAASLAAYIIVFFKRFAHSAGLALVGQRLNGMLRNRRVRPQAHLYDHRYLACTAGGSTPQDGPKMANDTRRCPKRPQDGPKMAPRWTQDGPKMAQDGHRMAPPLPQEGTRCDQDGP